MKKNRQHLLAIALWSLYYIKFYVFDLDLKVTPLFVDGAKKKIAHRTIYMYHHTSKGRIIIQLCLTLTSRACTGVGMA